MNRNSLKNRILSFILLCLIMVSLVSCAKDDADAERALEYENKLAELTLEKQRLISERHKVKNGMIETIGNNAYMSFVFVDLDAGLYEDVFPIFSEGDIKLVGTMALSVDELPGMDGNITMEQYQELVNCGWGTTLYFEIHDEDTALDSTASLTGFLDTMKSSLGAMNIPYPDSIVFDDGCYSVELDDVLKVYGMKTVLHDGENDFGLVAGDCPGEIWHAGVIGWRDLRRSTRLKTAIETSGGYASFKIGFENTDDRFSESFYPIEGEDTLNGERIDVFCRMINLFKKSVSTGNVHINTVSGVNGEMINYFALKEEYIQYSVVRTAEIDAMISDVEDRIFELYNEYF